MKIYSANAVSVGIEVGEADPLGANELEVYVRVDADKLVSELGIGPNIIKDAEAAFNAVRAIEQELAKLGFMRPEVRDAVRNGILSKLPWLTKHLTGK